ncbi:MAG: ABC transporter permease subunit [Clostridiales bacterium]|nr:ABC transporter permease subunit [Clostridiales bacterium]
MNKLKKIFVWAAILLFWLLVWQAAAMLIDKELIFVSPAAALRRLCQLGRTGAFWKSCFYSLARIFTGFLAGMIFGSVCGVFSLNRYLHRLISPLMTVIRCVPVASFIILTWYFMDREQVPAFAACIMVIPIVWGNVKKGMDEVNPLLLEVTNVYGFSFRKKMRVLYLPSVLPYFAAGCVTALGLSWKAGIAAEVLCRPALSIGNEIFLSKSYLETADLFAWTAVVVIFSVLIEKVFCTIIRRLGFDSR